MNLSRRAIVAGALGAPFLPPFAPPATGAGVCSSPAVPTIGAALTDSDHWVRLCGERRMLFDLAETSVVGGDIPEEIEDLCWPRVAEIDAEIAATQPETPRGLRAAMVEYLRELDGCAICDEALLRSLFRATLAVIGGASA